MPTLNWSQRDEAVAQAGRVKYRLLEEDPALSCGDENNENPLIQGDNHDALKALLPCYAGRVKCVSNGRETANFDLIQNALRTSKRKRSC